MNAGLSVELQLCSVRLGTVFLLYLCVYAVTGEVDIQSAAEFHPVLHPTFTYHSPRHLFKISE